MNVLVLNLYTRICRSGTVRDAVPALDAHVGAAARRAHAALLANVGGHALGHSAAGAAVRHARRRGLLHQRREPLQQLHEGMLWRAENHLQALHLQRSTRLPV